MALGLGEITLGNKSREKQTPKEESTTLLEYDTPFIDLPLDDEKSRPWQHGDNRPLRTRTLKARIAVEKARKRDSLPSSSSESSRGTDNEPSFFPILENVALIGHPRRIPSIDLPLKKTGALAFLNYLFNE